MQTDAPHAAAAGAAARAAALPDPAAAPLPPCREARFRRGRPALAAALAAALLAGPAAAQEPLSAIDWLSDTVATPPPPPPAPVTDNAVPDPVAVTPLDGPNVDAVGLMPPAMTGLPADLWGLGRTADIARAVAEERAGALPALRQLQITLLLAEAQPPADSGGQGLLFRTRLDKLLALGALDQAAEMLDRAGTTDAELFRRHFDVALLRGTETRACSGMLAQAALAPTFPARIFCLARSGDWTAAALSLRTGLALGQVTPEAEALLARFLDPDLFEGEPAPVPPRPVTPLDWRLFEAIGEPLPTANLPLAFAHADLSNRAGWKAQVEASERLVRAGVIAPNQWRALYARRDPSASGGLWERVARLQAFEAAMESGDPARVAAALTALWPLLEAAELEVPFAVLHGEAVAAMDLPGEAGLLARRVGYLSPGHARVAALPGADDAFLRGLALGNVIDTAAPGNLGRAVAPAFAADARPGAAMQALLDDRRLGEALLAAISMIDRGVRGDLGNVTEGLVLLRSVGLEDVARRTALQLMILERRG